MIHDYSFNYPINGYFMISKIAFNKENSQAIIGMMNFIGPIAGDGGLILLQKSCGHWNVVDYSILGKL